MNKLRDLLIDGVLMALPLGAAAYLVHKMVALLAPLLTKAVHILPPGHPLGLVVVNLAALALLALGLVAMGVFGYGEIIMNLSKPEDDREGFTAKVQGLMPTREDIRHMMPAVLRGTVLGSLLGVLPGGGAVLASFEPPASA